MEQDLGALIERFRSRVLGAYRSDPNLVREHHGNEEAVRAGGYGYRQVLELVQNGADAILEATESAGSTSEEGRVEVVLNERFLYVANTGSALNAQGINALLHSHSSPKRGNQIGRFGLGFKSLLSLGGLIDVFSTSASMRFDPKRCAATIRKELDLGEAEVVPSLRLAWSIDRQEEQQLDEVLNSLRWATTVVRVAVASPAAIAHLQAEIRDFPVPFLLFLQVPMTVTLNDGARPIRQLSRRPNGKDVLLNDGQVPSNWRVVAGTVRVNDAEARADATSVHFRDSVTMAWAVPIGAGREEAGRFWAFFPTQTLTSVPGILNAPWKLNNDRTAIIEGAWNNALMREGAALIAGALAGLADGDDPGRPVDAFPRDRPGEPAAPLIEALWARIEASALVADVSGQLQLPSTLLRPPADPVGRDANWYEQWRSLVPASVQHQWIHPSCLRAQRASRIEALSKRLARPQNQGPSPTSSLRRVNTKALFDVIASPDLAVAKSVLRVAVSFAMEREGSPWKLERQQLVIVPATDGQLRTPAQLFIGPADAGLPGREAVHVELVVDSECRAALTDTLGIKELDENGWRELLNEMLQTAIRFASIARSFGVGWSKLWAALGRAPADIALRFVETNRGTLRVRRRDGSWVLRDEVLLPGRIVQAADSLERNRNVLLDDSVHSDAGMPAQMNIGDGPSGLLEPLAYDRAVGEHGSFLSNWLSTRVNDYRNQLDTARNPQSAHLRPLDLAMPAGWMLLAQLGGQANGRLTCNLLRASKGLAKSVSFGHETVATYPKIQFDHPFWWFVSKHGCLTVGGEAVSLRTLVARHDLRWVQKLAEWAELVAPSCPLLVRNSPPITPNDLTELWLALIAHFVTADTVTKAEFGDFWTAAARDGYVPKALPSQSGDVPIDRVYVTDSAGLAAIASKLDRLAIALDPATREIWLKAGAKDLLINNLFNLS